MARLPFFHDFELLTQISCFYRILNHKYSQTFAYHITTTKKEENFLS